VHANQVLIARMLMLHQQTREAYGARKRWGGTCATSRPRRWPPASRPAPAALWHRGLAATALCPYRAGVAAGEPRHPESPQSTVCRVGEESWGAGDLTFVPPRTGWLTRAVWLDLSSRRIVGWAMSPHQTRSVGGRRGNVGAPPRGSCIIVIQANQNRATGYQMVWARRGAAPA
jgi:hypothetical protein